MHGVITKKSYQFAEGKISPIVETEMTRACHSDQREESYQHSEVKISPIVEMTNACPCDLSLPKNMTVIQSIKTTQRKKQRAFILLPVILTLTILAAVAYLLSREGAINAGNVIREHQQDTALYVAQAGYNHAVWQLNRQNCSGYADIPDTTLGDHSYLAEFTDTTGTTLTAGSPANIKVVGTLATGESYTLSRDREKIYTPLTTLTLQLGTDPGKDTLIDGFYNNRNHGDYEQGVSSSPAWLRYQFIQFDLSSIPAEASIVSAQLELKQTSTVSAGADAKISVHRVKQSWVEGTKAGGGTADGATWDTADGSLVWDDGSGGSYVSTSIGSTVITGSNVPRYWDISSLVQDWHKGLFTNHGLMLKGSGTVNVTFASKEDSTAADRPKLSITYACECGKTCGPAACINDDFADNFNISAFNNSDGTRNWSGDWIERDDSGTGPGSGKAQIIGGELRLNGTPSTMVEPISGATLYYPSMVRELDLSEALSAMLTFDLRTGSGVDAAEDSAVIEVSGDGGTNWTVLEDFIYTSANAAGSRNYNISAYIAANTQIRFRINAAYGGPDEYFYIDNLKITTNCTLAPLEQGLLAHWKLDDASGSVALDSVGGHDGNLTGGAAWTTGNIDGGLAIDGSDWVNVPHDNGLSLTQSFSLISWVKADSFGPTLSSYQSVLNKGLSGSDSNYWFGAWKDELLFGFWSGGSWTEVFTSGLSLQTNTWYHIAISFDNFSDQVRLYLDGTEVLNASMTASPTANSEDLFLGRTDVGEFWPGVLDDVRIYDRVLSSSEISTLASGSGGTPPSSCDGNFRDEFNIEAYSNNDGTLVWASDWLEINETDGITKGDEIVDSDDPTMSKQLRVQDNDGGGEGVMRSADLTGAGSASLTFDYRRENLGTTADYVSVQFASAATGGVWVEIDKLQGVATDGSYTSINYDITPYIASDTTLRLISSPDMARTAGVWFDNVEIQCTP